MKITRLDFAPNRTYRSRVWRTAFLAIGLFSFIGAAGQWALQKESVASLESQLSKVQPRMVAKPARSAAQERELEVQAKAVAQAVRQLNLPVATLIKTLQAPKDIQIALLGVDIGSGQKNASEAAAGNLRITGEAKTAQEMMTYVAFLDDQPLFKSVYLVKHELNMAVTERPYRFQLEAQWQE